MNIWSLLSFVALLAASAPSLYFVVKMRGSSAAFARLSLLLAAAFLVHGVFHLMEALESPPTVVLGTETGSAALILTFALVYWPLRRRG